MKTKNAHCFSSDQIQRKETNKQFSQHPTCLPGEPNKDENACISVWLLQQALSMRLSKIAWMPSRTENANALGPNDKLLIATTEIVS